MMRCCLWLITFVVALNLVLGQATVHDFCTKYSACRSQARKQLTKCTGGLAQMVLAKHGSNTSAVGEAESFKLCNAELADTITKFVKQYDRIDEKTLICTRVVSPSTYQMEKTQELVCQSVYNETELDTLEPKGIESNLDCYQVYEAELQKCNLLRDCCPQFESCREKIERESGISQKERLIVSKMQKCFNKSGAVLGESQDMEVEKSEREEVDIRFAPRQTPPPHRFDPKLPRATPVPRTKNGTLTKHGIFIIKSHNDSKDEKKQHKHKKPQKHDDDEIIEATTPGVHVAQEAARQLTEFQTAQAATQPVYVKQLKHKQHEQASGNLSDKQILNEMLCRQYAECESILESEEKECERAFGQHENADDSGIVDAEIRAIFLNNSHANDLQIRRKCLANIDAETQKHLVFLKEEIEWQNEQCTFGNGPDSSELNGCQNLEVLTELSALKRADPLSGDVQSCKQRLSGFRQKCNALQKCCPQRVSCALSNQSDEVHKYGDITAQLKMEQVLCEARHQRIQDGISR